MYILRNPQFLPFVATDLSGANNREYGVLSDLDAVTLSAYTTTALVSTGAIVITYTYRPIAGNSANAVTLGTVTIPAATAAGTCVKNIIKGVSCLTGGSIFCSVTTAATTSGSAQLYPLTTDNPQSDKAQSNVLLVTS